MSRLYGPWVVENVHVLSSQCQNSNLANFHWILFKITENVYGHHISSKFAYQPNCLMHYLVMDLELLKIHVYSIACVCTLIPIVCIQCSSNLMTMFMGILSQPRLITRWIVKGTFKLWPLDCWKYTKLPVSGLFFKQSLSSPRQQRWLFNFVISYVDFDIYHTGSGLSCDNLAVLICFLFCLYTPSNEVYSAGAGNYPIMSLLTVQVFVFLFSLFCLDGKEMTSLRAWCKISIICFLHWTMKLPLWHLFALYL